MTKNWIALNVVLLLISCLLSWQLKISADRFNAENDLGKISPGRDAKQRLTLEAGIPLLQPPRTYNAADFVVIPDKNVFSETRAREEKEQVATAPEIPALAQKPIFVGVTIYGNLRMASIIDPTNPAGGRKTQTKREGDIYQGYTITDISESQMILESGYRREVIPLHDGSKRFIGGGKTPILVTRIVSFGGGAAGSAPAIPAGASVPPGVAPRAGGPPPAGGAAQRTAANPQTGVRSAPPQMQQQGGAANWNEGTDAQGRRVIRTPFGDIVRDK